MSGAFDPRLYSLDFPCEECERAFNAYNGSRVGQTAAEWNEIKSIWLAGWQAHSELKE